MPEAKVREEDAGSSGWGPVGVWDVLEHFGGEGVRMVVRVVLLQHADDLLVPVVT